MSQRSLVEWGGEGRPLLEGAEKFLEVRSLSGVPSAASQCLLGRAGVCLICWESPELPSVPGVAGPP